MGNIYYLNVQWLREVCKGRNRYGKKVKQGFACIAHYLWAERNKRIFQHVSEDATAVIAVIKQFCRTLLLFLL